MCVICYKPKGKDMPTEDTLRKMWRANSDGAGYAYRKGKRVIYRKGFMTLDELLEELKDKDFKKTDFAIHFRISTSGKNDKKTCHPFPLSTSYGDLIKTEGEVDAVLFHNGVLGSGGLVNELSSDTQDFVVAMSPLFEKPIKSKAREEYVESIITGNRLLVMYKSGVKMYGDWKKDGDLYVSNTIYQSYSPYDYKTYHYGYNYGYDFDDYEWEKKFERLEEMEDKYEDELRKEVSTYKEQKELEDKTRKIWEEIDRKQYKFISEEELAMLKRVADDYTKTELYYNDYCYYYDEEQGLVWWEAKEPALGSLAYA